MQWPIHRILRHSLDLILPPSQADRAIRDETVHAIQRFYLPHRHGAHEAFLQYREPVVRALLRANKFESNRHAHRLLASLLTHRLDDLDQPVTLVPIPLATTRQRERGYNQVSAVVKQLPRRATTADIRIVPALKRVRDTTPQTDCKPEDRPENVAGAFAPTSPAGRIPPGSTVVILDDVVTSGSTLSAARAALKPSLPSDCKLYSWAFAG